MTATQGFAKTLVAMLEGLVLAGPQPQRGAQSSATSCCDSLGKPEGGARLLALVPQPSPGSARLAAFSPTSASSTAAGGPSLAPGSAASATAADAFWRSPALGYRKLTNRNVHALQVRGWGRAKQTCVR
jgi:hypothetical protein